MRPPINYKEIRNRTPNPRRFENKATDFLPQFKSGVDHLSNFNLSKMTPHNLEASLLGKNPKDAEKD